MEKLQNVKKVAHTTSRTLKQQNKNCVKQELASDSEKSPRLSTTGKPRLFNTPKRSKPNIKEIEEDEDNATMPIICHVPKYKKQVFNYAASPKEVQIKSIMSYFNTLHKEWTEYQKKVGIFKEWSEPIHSSWTHTGSLDKCPEAVFSLPQNSATPSSIPEANEVAPYVSRSGRQVKSRRPPWFELNDVNDFEDEGDAFVPESPKSEKKTTQKKKLTNSEIMSRSSLFKGPQKSSRAAKMIEKVPEEMQKQERQANEISKFERAMLVSDDDMESPVQVTASFGGGNRATHVKQDAAENDSPRIRVVPPSTGRNKRGQGFAPVNEATSTSEGRIGELDSPHSKRGLKRKTMNCPICSESFSVREIQEHASMCGVTAELEIENNFPAQEMTYTSLSKQSCDICDREFPMGTQFEVHVNECKKRRL